MGAVLVQRSLPIFFVLSLFVNSAFGLSLNAFNPSRQDQQEVKLFSQPHVFLTLSSVAGIDADGGWHDTEIELNWYNFPFTAGEGDWVGLFDKDPSGPQQPVIPLVYVFVNTTSASRGYLKTAQRFGRPNITSEDDLQGDNCLGYWIGYFKPNFSNTYPYVQNCFRKYPRWMNGLKGVIGDTPLSYLMIPGTHDAGAIREYDGLGAENPIVRGSVCQEEQLYRQFIHGIRYVDIRVSYYPQTPEKFWINHGSVRYQPLHTLFSAVKRFVSETNEIIFMDFHGFPVGFDDLETHDLLLDFVLEEMGDYLVWEDMVPRNPTPNDLWGANRTVILTYAEGRLSQIHQYLWPYLTHAWGDKNTVAPLEAYFRDEALPRYGCGGSWWSAMAEMTPKAEDHILYPLRGLRGFAQMMNIPLSYWWMRDDWYSRSMIVSTDFFLGNNIIEMAVFANENRAVCPDRIRM